MVIDDLDDVVAATCGWKPCGLLATRRGCRRRRRRRRCGGAGGKGARGRGDSAYAKQQNAACNDVWDRPSLEQRSQSVEIKPCSDLLHHVSTPRAYPADRLKNRPADQFVFLGRTSFREVLEAGQIEVDALLDPVRTLAGLFEGLTVVPKLHPNLGPT